MITITNTLTITTTQILLLALLLAHALSRPYQRITSYHHYVREWQQKATNVRIHEVSHLAPISDHCVS